jgi:stearoyl-CoA desaturase (delta-9 desaturase)
VALPTFGESWQNNHHAFASSAAIGLRWWQVDLGYWLIAGLESLGAVWDVRRPSARLLEARRATPREKDGGSGSGVGLADAT